MTTTHMACITVLSLGLSVVARGEVKPVHLFILSGQSNMAGLKHTTSFVPEAEKLFPDAEVVTIKVAAGGQPIRHWVESWDEIAREKGIDIAVARKSDRANRPDFYQMILGQVTTALKDRPRPASITFCWMQGERDARGSLAVAYEASLLRLVANLRKDLDCPDVNVVIGRLSDCGMSWPGWPTIRDVQVSIAETDPHGAWVDTDDCNDVVRNGNPVNDLHYSKEGYALFGRRLAHQAALLIRGEKPAANGRPEAAGTTRLQVD